MEPRYPACKPGCSPGEGELRTGQRPGCRYPAAPELPPHLLESVVVMTMRLGSDRS